MHNPPRILVVADNEMLRSPDDPASPAFVGFWTAASTGRRNTSVKSLRWGFKLQGLTRPFIELTRYFVEMSLRVHRQVGALRKVLPQQTIGVLI
jgi:hypothetical protein